MCQHTKAEAVCCCVWEGNLQVCVGRYLQSRARLTHAWHSTYSLCLLFVLESVAYGYSVVCTDTDRLVKPSSVVTELSTANRYTGTDRLVSPHQLLPSKLVVAIATMFDMFSLLTGEPSGNQQCLYGR